MKLIHTFVCTILLFLSVILTHNVAAQDKPLRIAVASNFSHSLQEILPNFTAKTGINVDVISGASGSLFQQIQHGAPFDVFLSADSLRPKTLETQQLIISNSRHSYALGLLAFYSTKNSMGQNLTFQQFIDNISTLKRIAIANPEIAPYGEAAKQVFTHLNLWQHIGDKLILGINVNQTFQQTQSGAVDGGIVALSQLIQIKQNTPSNDIPIELYQPIDQQMVILRSSKNIAAAEKFQQYLLSESAQNTIATLGYLRAKSGKRE